MPSKGRTIRNASPAHYGSPHKVFSKKCFGCSKTLDPWAYIQKTNKVAYIIPKMWLINVKIFLIIV